MPSETPTHRRRAPRPTQRRRPIALDGDERLERLTLIEFVWDISSGIQPVILASRRLLH